MLCRKVVQLRVSVINGSHHIPLQIYPDIQNFRLPAASCISPCGTWVLAGSDCGLALAYNTDTGVLEHVFKELMYDKPVSAVVFHPLEHAMAVGSIEPNSKVGLYISRKEAVEDNVKERGSESQQMTTSGMAEPTTSLYPRGQVAKLIQDRADPEAEREDARTPVDLQDIVEKLNNAIKDCRLKNNLTLEEGSPK